MVCHRRSNIRLQYFLASSRRQWDAVITFITWRFQAVFCGKWRYRRVISNLLADLRWLKLIRFDLRRCDRHRRVVGSALAFARSCIRARTCLLCTIKVLVFQVPKKQRFQSYYLYNQELFERFRRACVASLEVAFALRSNSGAPAHPVTRINIGTGLLFQKICRKYQQMVTLSLQWLSNNYNPHVVSCFC